MAGLLDFLQSTSNSVASNVSAPVDGLAWALRKLGVPMPANPMGGSDWMQEKGLTKPVQQSGASLAGEFVGMAGPMVAAAKAPQIVRGLLQMGENAMMPQTLNKQAGVVRLPFLDDAEAAYQAGIPETAIDRSGRSWNVRVGNSLDGVTFEKNGRVMGVHRDPSQQYYADAGHRDAANSIYRLQDEKRAARSLHSELMAPSPALPLPEWAKVLTATQNESAAGLDWWSQTLKNKSNASFDAFADAAKDTPLMLYGKGSGASSAADVAQAYPGITSKQSGGDLLFGGKNGNLMVFGADTANPVIRSTGAGSKGRADGGGKELYQAAYNWAGNNGKMIAPDTGLTDINELRKLGNVLSAQVRGGKPVADMNAGGLLGPQGIPQLWQAEAKLATKRAPEIKALQFDGVGFNLNDADLLQSLAKVDPGFERGVGVMTAKRSALAKWLKTATPEHAKKAAAALVASGSGAVFAGTKD